MGLDCRLLEYITRWLALGLGLCLLEPLVVAAGSGVRVILRASKCARPCVVCAVRCTRCLFSLGLMKVQPG